MIAKIKQKLPGASPLRGRLLDRVIIWSGVLLVVSVAAFGTYYYFDQQSQGGAPSKEQIMRAQLDMYEQAVREDPNNITNRLALGDGYLSVDRYADAQAQYEAALVINDESTLGHIGLGRALFEQGNFDSATENFQKILDQYEKEDISGAIVEAARYYLGSIALQRGNTDEAITHLTEATKLERADADAWFLLGTAYRQKGDLDKAIEAIEQSTLFVPDFTDAFQLLAQVYQDKGDSAGVLYAQGMVSYSKGDLREAARQLQAAVDASPSMAKAYAGLGLILENIGQKEGAASAYQQALELDSANFNARSGLARLSGQTDESSNGGLPANHPAATPSATEQGVTP